MPHATEATTIRCARKDHFCTWCLELIERGSSYVTWVWFDEGRANTVKMHGECYDAALECDCDEFTPGDNPRGCNCGRDKGCDRCKSMAM